MNSWQSHIIRMNGKRFSIENQEEMSELINCESDELVKQVLLFFKEWISEQNSIRLKTSGTTGKPKTISVSKQSMIESAKMTAKALGLRQGMKALLCLSSDFVAGKMMIVRAMQLEMELITTNVSANPIENLNQKIDFAAMVPLQLSKILQQTPKKLSLIKKLIIGGSAIDSQLEEALQSIESQCFHTYGMTETLSHIALRKLNGEDRTDWFTPLGGIQISLDDRACLCILAPFVQETLIITNDLAEIDLKGRFKILGRTDDVIVSAGKKIHPEDVERKIKHLFHKHFIISSVKDDYSSESVVLYVEEKFGIKALFNLWENLIQSLEPHEIPRKIIQIEQIPFLESGKLDRKCCREMTK